MIRPFIIAVLSLFSAGCVETMVGNLGGDRLETPVLESVTKEHKKALLDIGEEQDRKQQQSRGLGLIANDTFEDYANSILNKLKTASGVNSIPGRVYIVAENAWSARTSASGNIYIPIGMLGDIESEDVFAALLAHELSHAIQNHADSDIVGKVSKKSVFAANLATRLSVTPDQDSAAYLDSLRLFAASEMFLSPCWSRRQEIEADFLGLDLLIRAGYSPNAMEVLLQTVEVLDERNMLELERRKTVLKEANSRVRDEAIRNLDYTSYLTSAFSDVANFTSSKMKGFMAAHHSGEERIDTLREYKKKHYRRLPRKKISIESWRAALNTEDVKQAVTALEKTFQAIGYLSKSELTQGEEVIKSALMKSTQKQSYVRTVFADIRKGQGKDQYALKNHEVALEGKYPSFESYKYVSGERIKTASDNVSRIGYFDELLSVFNDYGKPPEFFMDMIIIAEDMKLTDKVVLLRAECSVKYAGDGVSCSREQKAEENNFSVKSYLEKL
jgi:Zn-dependent protease with chaperone function